MNNTIIKKFQFKLSDLNLNRKDFLFIMGYPNDAPDYIKEMLDEILDECTGFENIKGGYRILENAEFLKENHSMIISSTEFSLGKIVFSQLKKSENIAFFACTAGVEFQNIASQNLDGINPAKGYMLDLLGSEVVNKVVNIIHDSLEDDVSKKGLNVTNNFSPGYCQWPLAENFKIFSHLPDNFCDIRLNDSAYMQPVKSVCGMIGIGKEVSRKAYQCDFCELEECIYRNRLDLNRENG